MGNALRTSRRIEVALLRRGHTLQVITKLLYLLSQGETFTKVRAAGGRRCGLQACRNMHRNKLPSPPPLLPAERGV
jgi:hypothetical protein